MDAALTAEDAAVILHVQPATVRAWARAGYLPGRKLRKDWRFTREAVQALLAPEPRPVPISRPPAPMTARASYPRLDGPRILVAPRDADGNLVLPGGIVPARPRPETRRTGRRRAG